LLVKAKQPTLKSSFILSNSYFTFKQFTIKQDRCAMKVCTDACLFGAWVAAEYSQKALSILDIGAGTGLLSLMLAQKTRGTIDSVEIDQGAYQQAKENIEASKWKERINICHADIKQINLARPYVLIIANPPFFENNLTSPKLVSNMARHEETLTLEALLSAVALHLAPEGAFAVLLPYHRSEECINMSARFGLFPVKVISARQTGKHHFFRVMILLKREKVEDIYRRELSIKDPDHYTMEFTMLLKDYYLYL
jgi:tRNA1Val (adenine37-N6)-methyltransferase